MDYSIGRVMTRLARKSRIYIGSALDKYDLTAAEQPFFMALQHYEGITQEELTAIVCVDKAATARAVKSLESKGFLVRVQDGRDRRQNRIYPTDKAKQLEASVKRELLRFNALLTEGIDPQSLDLVHTALIMMENNLKNIFAGGQPEAEPGGQRNEANR